MMRLQTIRRYPFVVAVVVTVSLCILISLRQVRLGHNSTEQQQAGRDWTFASSNDIIKLDIGGAKFHTTRDILTANNNPRNYFTTLLRSVAPSQDGFFFVDRNPDIFKVLLNFLRSGELQIPPEVARESVLLEASFYGIDVPLNRYSRIEVASLLRDWGQTSMAETQKTTGPLSRTNLSQIDLSRMNLASVSFTGATLVRTNLEYSVLRGCDFEGADLRGANLQYADLRGANLNHANLAGANLAFAMLHYGQPGVGGITLQEGTNFQGANFYKAQLGNTKFQDANLFDASFSFANILHVQFVRVNMSRAWLDYASINTVSFENVTLTRASFRSATLSSVQFGNSDLRFTQFNGATIHVTQFGNTNMQFSCLDNAKLSGSFVGAQMQHASMVSVGMHCVDLQRANLEGASLFAATVSKSNLQYVNFYKADLQYAMLNSSAPAYYQYEYSTPPCQSVTMMHEANFTSAVLVGANFDRSHVSSAVFTDSVLDKASFREIQTIDFKMFKGASLVGTDFSGSGLQVPSSFSNFNAAIGVTRTT